MTGRIEIITNLFSPDELGGANLYTDMAAFFKEHGWITEITTTFSYYPKWEIAESDKGVLRRVDTVDGNKVTRLRMYIPKIPSGKSRMISEISFLLALLWNEMIYGKRPGLVLTACPMFSQLCHVALMDSKRSSPVFIVVQDFAIGAAEELGIIRSNLVLNILKKVENLCFSSANVLSSISRPMVDRLISNVRNRPIALLPNWIHKSLECTIAKRRKTHQSQRQESRIFYSGNVGVKQALEEFIRIFLKLNATSWSLNIRGDGANMEIVRELTKGANNIEHGDVQCESDYVSSLFSCTFYLVTQKAVAGENAYPSKLLPALATGTPVLAVCDPSSALGEAVQKGGFGEVVSMDYNEIETVLSNWGSNPSLLSAYSENALKESRKYSRDNVLGNYLNTIQDLLEDDKRNSC